MIQTDWRSQLFLRIFTEKVLKIKKEQGFQCDTLSYLEAPWA